MANQGGRESFSVNRQSIRTVDRRKRLPTLSVRDMPPNRNQSCEHNDHQRLPAVRALLAVTWGLASMARAEFVAPTLWSRQDLRSTYQQWDVFTDADGDPPNVPDIGLFNPNSPANGVPNVRDTSGGSFLTGGGNIYSFSVATDIDVIVPNYALGDWFHTTVILQTRTQGSEIAYASARIGTVAPVAQQELFREPVGGPFGDSFTVDYFFRWELPGNLNSYTLEFPASASSMSLDRVAVNTLALLEGDANRDNTVDIFDVNLVSAHWGEGGPAGDVNFDGTVDIFDVNLISANWGHAIGGGANLGASTVPEPAAGGLALVGVLSLMLAGWHALRNEGRGSQFLPRPSFLGRATQLVMQGNGVGSLFRPTREPVTKVVGRKRLPTPWCSLTPVATLR